MQKPTPHRGLRHLAIYVTKFNECRYFYETLLGMKVVWEPDEDNLYLSGKDDNFALHRARADFVLAKDQRLDHLGFFLSQPHEVDEWHAYLVANDVEIKAPPKNHRDGTRSFYCADPDGNIVQMIYYPME